mmetsp:Transcript_3067/g.7119  ORF Transcript_3067/g.7119 Transcript_3067/m.7119 type:complete len:827 (-) Transcript_3067:110-2590(-)
MGYLLKDEKTEHFLSLDGFERPPLQNTLGYKVGVLVSAVTAPEDLPADVGGALFPGRVVGFNTEHKTVRVLFDAEDPETEVDLENFAWESAALRWLMPPTVARPREIADAVGYRVEVGESLLVQARDTHPDLDLLGASAGAVAGATEGKVQGGVVISVDAQARTMRVLVDGVALHRHAVTMPFEAPVAWLTAGSVPKEVRQRTPKRDNDGVKFSCLVRAHRPSSLLAAVGHLVEVRSSEEGAKEGDLHPGVIIAADLAAGTVKVLYDGDANGSGGDGSAGAGAEQEPDVEDFPFASPDIYWVHTDSAPSTARSDIPKRLSDTLGHKVDVRSREEGALEGDYFSGTVRGVDADRQTVRVAFDGDRPQGQGQGAQDGDNGSDDFEDIPWDSKDIHWLSDASVRSRERHPRGKSVGAGADADVDGSASLQISADADAVGGAGAGADGGSLDSGLGMPLTADAAMGRRVLLHSSEFEFGRVVRCSDGTVDVEFDDLSLVTPRKGEAETHPRIIATLPWISTRLHWTALPVLSNGAEAKTEAGAAISQKPSPEKAVTTEVKQETPKQSPAKFSSPACLADAVGWAVEVQSTDPDALKGDVFVGQVRGVYPAEGTVKVLFAAEDGTFADDDFENFPFDAKTINSISPPAPTAAEVAAASVTAAAVAATAAASAAAPAAAPAPAPAPAPTSPSPTRATTPASAALAMGWTVEVRSTAPAAHPDDVFVGEVGGVDKGNIRVHFRAEDGSIAKNDFELLPYISPLIRWVRPPAVPRPATLEAALGYSVLLDVADAVGAVEAVEGTQMRVKIGGPRPLEVLLHLESVAADWPEKEA